MRRIILGTACALGGCFSATAPRSLVAKPADVVGPGVFAHTSCRGSTAWAFTLDGTRTPKDGLTYLLLVDSADVLKLGVAGSDPHILEAERWIPGSGRWTGLVNAGDTVQLGCAP